LEDQQKVCVAFIRLISTLGALGHCAIWKYINQNWMEGVSDNIFSILCTVHACCVLFHCATANKCFLTSGMCVKFHSRHNNLFLYQIEHNLAHACNRRAGSFWILFYSAILVEDLNLELSMKIVSLLEFLFSNPTTQVHSLMRFSLPFVFILFDYSICSSL